MNRDELEALYRDRILPENRTPYHFERIANAPEEVLAYNTMCGDKYTLFLDAESGHFDPVHFHGMGCAISKASTSLLMRRIEGKSPEEALTLIEQFLDALASGRSNLNDSELDILVRLKDFEGRMECVKLSWEALRDHLEETLPNNT